MNKELLTIVGIGAGSLAVGYLAGYWITKKRLLVKLEEEYQDATEETRTRLIKRFKADDQYATPKMVAEANGRAATRIANETSAEAIERLVESYSGGDELENMEPVDGPIGPFTKEGLDYYAQKREEEEERKRTRVNIWDSDESKIAGETAAEEVLDKTKPYVISSSDFQIDNPEWEKSSITYFDGDDTLADERDQMIPNIDNLVGGANMIRFGDRSDDPNVVYIRNEVLETDFEIFRDLRSFTEVILGLQDPDAEENRSKKRKVPKMRDDE